MNKLGRGKLFYDDKDKNCLYVIAATEKYMR